MLKSVKNLFNFCPHQCPCNFGGHSGRGIEAQAGPSRAIGIKNKWTVVALGLR